MSLALLCALFPLFDGDVDTYVSDLCNILYKSARASTVLAERAVPDTTAGRWASLLQCGDEGGVWRAITGEGS